ncbi:MAG: CAP domain-containing protein [Paracoccaceae bacterium]
MFRIISPFLLLVVLLSACATPTTPTMGPDGNPLPRVYRISSRDTGPIQFRILDAVNALRGASGTATLALNAQLNAAAATHSRDMSVQNRPWHFGSDGSSPIDRIQRSGYAGPAMGENISETFETELETLSAWMDQPDTRAVILDRNARNLGFSWFQESSGKIWWTLVTGG